MRNPVGDRKLFLMVGASAVLATAAVLVARSLIESPVAEAPVPTAAPAPVAVSAEPRPARPGTRARADLWESFDRKYGPGLEPVFLPSGRLVSAARGPQRPVSGAGRAGFDPSDPRSAIARAREILEDVAGMLGVVPESPLGEPAARGSALGAQVFFHQRFGDARVAPAGQVTIELSASGELKALYSDYVPGLSATNPVRIGADQARSAANAAVREPGSAVLPRGGAPVVWVSRPASRSGKVEGRNAYQFLVHGRQVIVDASTGEILYRRDVRRQ